MSPSLPTTQQAPPTPGHAAEAVPPAVDGARSDGFAAIFRQYAPYVMGLVRRLGVRDAEVEDVAQDVFLAVHRQLPEFEGRSALSTWICGIAVRAAHNHRRRAYRRREVPALIGGADEPRAEAPQHARLLASEQAAALLAALDTLSEPQRQVFVLYEIEQLPMQDVARVCGCPRFTAYTRLRGARARVQKHFTRLQRAGARP